jgi:hypothetical protein
MVGRNLAALWGSALLYFLAAIAVDAIRNDPHVREMVRWRWAAAREWLATSMPSRLFRRRRRGGGDLLDASPDRSDYARLQADVEMQQDSFSRHDGGTASADAGEEGRAHSEMQDGDISAPGQGPSETGRSASQQGFDDTAVVLERQRVAMGTAQPGRPADVLTIHNLTQVCTESVGGMVGHKQEFASQVLSDTCFLSNH